MVPRKWPQAAYGRNRMALLEGRAAVASVSTWADGHDGAWPSKITRRARPRGSVALHITGKHARTGAYKFRPTGL